MEIHPLLSYAKSGGGGEGMQRRKDSHLVVRLRESESQQQLEHLVIYMCTFS